MDVTNEKRDKRQRRMAMVQAWNQDVRLGEGASVKTCS